MQLKQLQKEILKKIQSWMVFEPITDLCDAGALLYQPSYMWLQ